MQIKLIIRFSSLLLLILFLKENILSQQSTFRIFFKDKGKQTFVEGSEIFEKTLASISKRALERRSNYGMVEPLITIEDAPLNENYISELEQIGALVMAKIKWENYCVIYLDDIEKLEQIRNLEFVKFIQPTSSKFNELTFGKNEILSGKKSLSVLNFLSNNNSEDSKINHYGFTYHHLNMLNIDKVHESGIYGDSVLIGFLDSGFRPRLIKSLQNIKILNEYDFIYRDSITSNQQFDHPNQDHHGTMCLSLAVAYEPETFVGASPNSSVALAKTENLYYERKIEEDWFLAGTEWLESLGVDIISASLGYSKFDSNETSYKYNDLDGKIPLSSKAVNLASKRGVLFVVAAGNNGPNSKTLNSPADADEVLSVGAVDSNRVVAGFSSRGTDGINRIRPHISAPGVKLPVPNPPAFSEYITSSGTSLATPLISGASALILSAFPELKQNEVKNILFNSATNKDEPDNNIGYGIPDIFSAMINYDVIISEMNTYPTNNFQRVLFKITYKEPINFASINIYDNSFGIITTLTLKKYLNNIFYADIPNTFFTKDTLLLSVKVDYNNYGKSRRKPIQENKYIYLIKNSDKIDPLFQIDDLIVKYVEDANSFVYPNIAERSSGSVKLVTFVDKSSSIRLIITDILGKTIYNEYIGSDVGVIERNIPVTELANGLYIIQILKENNIESIKFIIF